MRGHFLSQHVAKQIKRYDTSNNSHVRLLASSIWHVDRYLETSSTRSDATSDGWHDDHYAHLPVITFSAVRLRTLHRIDPKTNPSLSTSISVHQWYVVILIMLGGWTSANYAA